MSKPIPVRPVGAPDAAIRAARPEPVPTPWRWSNLWLAPHRLAFFSGMVVLMASGLWWAKSSLQYSTAKNFTKNTTKWINVGNNKSTAKTVKKLKAKKKS